MNSMLTRSYILVSTALLVLLGYQNLTLKQALAETPPPMVDLNTRHPLQTQGSPALGPERADYELVLFADFQCPACVRAFANAQQLQQRYPDQVRLVFKHFPLNPAGDTPLATAASMAAFAQGQFWQMGQQLFSAAGETFTEALVVQMAAELGLEMQAFRTDLELRQWADFIHQDRAQAIGLGLEATPVLFVNGVRLPDHSLFTMEWVIQQLAVPNT